MTEQWGNFVQHIRWYHIPTGRTGVFRGTFFNRRQCLQLLESWSHDHWLYQPTYTPYVSPTFIGPPVQVGERDYTDERLDLI